MKKKEYNEIMDVLTPRLSELQRKCRVLGIPAVVVFEGLGASGKGMLMNKLIQPLDPRGFQAYATTGESEEEKMRPFLWRFWTKTPARGRISLFIRGWYMRVLIDRFEGRISEDKVTCSFQEINSFERQLHDDGVAIIKFFLYISREEQEKRFDLLMTSKETAWRVSEGDLKRNKEFRRYLQMNEEMLEKTDTEYAPWTIVEAMDMEYASVKIIKTVIDTLSKKVSEAGARTAAVKESGQVVGIPEKILSVEDTVNFASTILGNVDLDKTMLKEEYQERLPRLQERMYILQSELYRRRMPVIIAFEGWDASGKGGAIKRLTENIDPRGYMVIPTSSPDETEKAHHYLWRFWNTIPKSGHIAIYDRTWYGRVMVERIEGYCAEHEWKRAYKEINQMEEHLAHYGTVILKFWMHIDQNEQEARFRERLMNPEKNWKITDEDWRNREKWADYETAADEMLIRTSTTYAPWTIIEANSKYYARIKVLETIIAAIEERIK